MSADHLEHADETPHAHDPAEEIAHARRHAIENIGFFAFFFFLILCAVANYEFSSANNYWVIFALGMARVILIAFFFNWLIKSFSLVIRTLVFTVFFFGGMVVLSIWDSPIPHYGNPVNGSIPTEEMSLPKPPPPATPAP
jgi:heme/copper-type cytochrome/quinol oxidase subunit 4